MWVEGRRSKVEGRIQNVDGAFSEGAKNLRQAKTGAGNLQNFYQDERS